MSMNRALRPTAWEAFDGGRNLFDRPGDNVCMGTPVWRHHIGPSCGGTKSTPWVPFVFDEALLFRLSISLGLMYCLVEC